jgi:LPXTG-site transpeptidase (sortase) family protein
MNKIVNTFSIIFVLAALGSVFQLGSLGNGISATFAESIEATVATVVPTRQPGPTPTNQPADTFTPERIVINDVDIDLLVFSQPLKNGTWEVLPHVANFAEGTSLVNPKEGNVGIFAHDRLDGFTRIKQLSEGAEIVVYGPTQKAVYKVTSSKIIEPTDVDAFSPSKEPTLTLITCDGLFSEKRYMVKASLVKIEVKK